MSGPYYAMRNWEESIRWARKIIEKYPNINWPHVQLARIYLYLGDYDSTSYHAEKHIEKSVNKLTSTLYVTNCKGYILWKHGNKEEAIALLEPAFDYNLELIKTGYNLEFIKTGNTTVNNYLFLAESFLIKGEHDKALEYLRKLYNKFSTTTWQIEEMEMNPIFQIIKSDERFQKILNTMKSNWQKEHEKVRIWLKENNLLKI